MAVSRADKEAELQTLEAAFRGSESAILVDYRGLNVPQVTELRRQLRGAKANYRVVKNTIARRALKGTKFEALTEHFTGTTAVAYTATDPVTGEPLALSNGITDSLDQLFGFDYPGWTVGLNFALPIRNVGAKAESRRAELDLDRADTEIEFVRRQVALEVRAAARDVDTAFRSIAATRTAREAAERNLEAERKRFENGMTTNFNVMQIQQDLSDALSREVLALAHY